jgi:hypothetical protein
MVAWQSFGQDGSDWGVFGQRFDSDGALVDGEFQINSSTEYAERSPDVTRDLDGNFLVVWVRAFAPVPGIFGQRFNSLGATVDGEFRVDQGSLTDPADPAVAQVGDGGFMVVWEGYQDEATSKELHAQEFDGVGFLQGPELLVNSFTPNDHEHAAIAGDADGRYVVAWMNDGQDGSGLGVYAQRFQAEPAPSGRVAVGPATSGASKLRLWRKG